MKTPKPNNFVTNSDANKAKNDSNNKKWSLRNNPLQNFPPFSFTSVKALRDKFDNTSQDFESTSGVLSGPTSPSLSVKQQPEFSSDSSSIKSSSGLKRFEALKKNCENRMKSLEDLTKIKRETIEAGKTAKQDSPQKRNGFSIQALKQKYRAKKSEKEPIVNGKVSRIFLWKRDC